MTYVIHNKIILRTPNISFDHFFTEGSIKDKIENKKFKESLYLASPSISESFLSNNPVKINYALPSLTKYFTRACFRCTPFGLFAGLNIVQFGKKTDIILTENQRYTRLDMDYLYRLSSQLASSPFLIKRIKFFPNNSIYSIANNLRYIDFSLKANKRYYNLNEVIQSKELKNILNWSKEGTTVPNLIKLLTTLNPQISNEDANHFIFSLIKNQILISELEPALTGEEFSLQILKTLYKEKDNEEIRNVILTLEKVNQLIKQLDIRKTNTIQDYKNILSLLTNLHVEYEENKIFQVDLLKTTKQNLLNEVVRQKLELGVSVLSKLVPPLDNLRLSHFKTRFNERYENKEVALLEVLDAESGIGYPDLIEKDPSSLISDIILPNTSIKTIQINEFEQWLFKKLQQTLFANKYSINLEEEDLTKFPSNLNDLPPSFSVLFKIINFESNTIHIESIGGSSAAQLLGRFAYADNQINDLIKEITSVDQINYPNVIFAEIVHLPENRIGNIMLHPAFYNYEIPYLAKSSLPNKQQILLQDLYISLEGDYIKLISKSLRKEIIPRLSNAHNFSLSELPVYQFLCDMQNQNRIPDITFNWGNLAEEFVFLPRVTYGTIILHLATWHLTSEDWGILLEKDDDLLNRNIKEFRKKWKIPRYVTLADSDIELFIDFENIHTITSLIQTIRTRKKIILKEFLFDLETPIKDKYGNKFNSQFIASCLSTETVSETTREMNSYASPKEVPSTFVPGSDWVYYKYYCGIKMADTVLIKAIKPLTQKLLKDNLIDSWFFVRYKDSHSHLRVRFHLKDQLHLADVLKTQKKYFEKFIKSGVVWKIQMDTYVREIERYGHNSIKLSEQIFFYDSVAVVNFLDNIGRSESDETRWLWGISAVDKLMENFKFSLEDKMLIMGHLKIIFANEFKLEKSSKFQLDKKYRKYRAKIESILNSNNSNGHSGFLKIIQAKSTKITPIIKEIMLLKTEEELATSISKLVQSYIHMLLNRLIPNSQRFHEMVIYDFMHRYYRSQIARNQP